MPLHLCARTHRISILMHHSESRFNILHHCRDFVVAAAAQNKNRRRPYCTRAREPTRHPPPPPPPAFLPQLQPADAQVKGDRHWGRSTRCFDAGMDPLSVGWIRSLFRKLRRHVGHHRLYLGSRHEDGDDDRRLVGLRGRRGNSIVSQQERPCVVMPDGIAGALCPSWWQENHEADCCMTEGLSHTVGEGTRCPRRTFPAGQERHPGWWWWWWW